MQMEGKQNEFFQEAINIIRVLKGMEDNMGHFTASFHLNQLVLKLSEIVRVHTNYKQ